MKTAAVIQRSRNSETSHFATAISAADGRGAHPPGWSPDDLDDLTRAWFDDHTLVIDKGVGVSIIVRHALDDDGLGQRGADPDTPAAAATNTLLATWGPA